MAGARFQPLLLLGAVAAYLPLLIVDDGSRWWLVPGVAVLAVASVLAWWWGRRPEVTEAQRHGIGFALTVVTLAAYAVLLEVAASVVDLLPFAVLLVGVISLSPHAGPRLLMQLLTLGVVARGLVRHEVPGAEAAVILLLLAATVAIVEVFAAQLSQARAAQQAARRQAAERAALLMAVQRLPGRQPDQVAGEVAGTLRGLGFPHAAVVPYGSDGQCPVEADAVGPDPADAVGPDPAGPDPASSPTVRVPVTVDGVVRAQIEVGAGPDADHAGDLGLVAVLAGHLAGVWETSEQLERQRDRLRRATELEQARAGFLEAVSEELHRPLVEIRAGAAVLRSGGLDGAPPTEVLELVAAQGEHLATIIAALLDVPRSPADAARRSSLPDGSRIQPVRVGAIIAGYRDRVEVRGDAGVVDLRVAVAPMLIDHALGLWLQLQTESQPKLVLERGVAGATLRLRTPAGAPATLPQDVRRVRPLVTRLLVAAGARWDGGSVVLLPEARQPVEQEP